MYTHWGVYGALGACLGKGNSDLTECKYKGPEAGIAPGVLQELQGDQGGWRILIRRERRCHIIWVL